MPPTSESHFGKLVPGFEFLQGLASNASSALPGLGQWIAPTLDPDELEKRISELRTVQFWLEQNARLLATTVQALEVQRMTLATLRSMNVPMAPLHQSLQARPRAEAPAAAQETPRPRPAGKAASPAGGADAAMVDPMQWWGALTHQFTELAASAMKEAMPDGRPVASIKPAAAQGGSAASPAIDAHEPAEAARAKAAAAPARAAPAAGTAPAAKTSTQPARRRDRSPSTPSR
jgi:hypothetical protein